MRANLLELPSERCATVKRRGYGESSYTVKLVSVWGLIEKFGNQTKSRNNIIGVRVIAVRQDRTRAAGVWSWIWSRVWFGSPTLRGHILHLLLVLLVLLLLFLGSIVYRSDRSLVFLGLLCLLLCSVICGLALFSSRWTRNDRGW